MKKPYHHGDLERALLSAVEQIITSDGLEAVTLRAVAAATGVSHTAPKHHFGSKSGLITAFATEGFRILTRELGTAFDDASDRDPVRRFRAVGDAYLGFAERHPAHFQVMFQPSLFDPEDAAYLSESTAAYEVLLEAVSRVAASGLVPTAETGNLALFAWAMVHGLAVLWHQGALDTHDLSFPSLASAGEATLPLIAGLLADGPTKPQPPTAAESDTSAVLDG